MFTTVKFLFTSVKIVFTSLKFVFTSVKFIFTIVKYIFPNVKMFQVPETNVNQNLIFRCHDPERSDQRFLSTNFNTWSWIYCRTKK